MPGIQCGVIADQVTRVLAVGVADAPDGADVKSDNVAIAGVE
jgi:hypothetical protein